MRTTTPFRRGLAIATATVVGLGSALAATSPASAVAPFSVTGTLTGKPTAASPSVALVDVRADLYEFSQSDQGTYIGTTFTGAGGAFDFGSTNESLVAGTYAINFNYCAPGATTPGCDPAYPEQWTGGSYDASRSTKFTLTAESPAAVKTHEMLGAATVSGTAFMPDGVTPATGSYVFIDGQGTIDGRVGAAVGSDGTYAIAQVPARASVLGIQYDGSYFDCFGSPSIPIDLTPQQVAGDQVVTMTQEPRITMRFVDAANQPVAGIQSVQWTKAADSDVFAGPRGGDLRQTDATGEYSLCGTAGEQYKLVAYDVLDEGTPLYESTWFGAGDATSGDIATAPVVAPSAGEQVELGDITVDLYAAPLRLLGQPRLFEETNESVTRLAYDIAPFSGRVLDRTLSWTRNGVPLEQNPSEYPVIDPVADAGARYQLTVTGSNNGSVATSTSAYIVGQGQVAPISPVTDPVDEPTQIPSTTPPSTTPTTTPSTLVGTTAAATPKLAAAKVGKKLTAKVKKTSFESGTKLTYRWQKLVKGTWKNIKKATKSSYTPKAADRGVKLRLVVTAKKAGFTTVKITTKPTKKVAARARAL